MTTKAVHLLGLVGYNFVGAGISDCLRELQCYIYPYRPESYSMTMLVTTQLCVYCGQECGGMASLSLREWSSLGVASSLVAGYTQTL